MKHRAALGLAILLIALLTGAPRAQAGLRFCNELPFNLSVAIGYADGAEGLAGQGWWVVEAGQCKEAIAISLTNRYYYFYAMGLVLLCYKILRCERAGIAL